MAAAIVRIASLHTPMRHDRKHHYNNYLTSLRPLANMPTMQRFLTKPALGLEITARSVTAGLVARRNDAWSLLASRSVELSPGLVSDGFAPPVFGDRAGLLSILRSALQDVVSRKVRRTALSLPDNLFRFQMLEFDEFPASDGDRDRLVRWRLEKTAAFDISGTVVRYQVIPRAEQRQAVLASVIKSEVLSQYEDLLTDLSLEPWCVGPSSFHALNLYAPVIAARDVKAYGLVWIAESSYSTLVIEGGNLRFYRFREIKPGAPGEVAVRIARELDDFIHFYTHRDRDQRPGLVHLYCAGDPAVAGDLAGNVRTATGLKTAVLTPAEVIPASGPGLDSLAAVIGAGGAI